MPMKMAHQVTSLNADLPPCCSPIRGIQVEIFVEVTETNVQVAAAEAWTDGETCCMAVGHCYVREAGEGWVRSLDRETIRA